MHDGSVGRCGTHILPGTHGIYTNRAISKGKQASLNRFCTANGRDHAEMEGSAEDRQVVGNPPNTRPAVACPWAQLKNSGLKGHVGSTGRKSIY